MQTLSLAKKQDSEFHHTDRHRFKPLKGKDLCDEEGEVQARENCY